MATAANGLSSAGHKIGQVVGDWWELHVVFPILREIADELGLFLDNRSVTRTCRAGKLLWEDSEGNNVDYDYVLELGGSTAVRGVPVAFFESFWRRGARHSKDKARDDTNKLLPMRQTYPTARFLAIAASGEFTEPAREYVRTRNVELLFVAKPNIVTAFERAGLTVDYPDNLSEAEKNSLAIQLEENFPGHELEVSGYLREIAGEGAFRSFKQRVKGALTATPQEIIVTSLKMSEPQVFRSIVAASNFLSDPNFTFDRGEQQFTYEVSYSDGSEFSRQMPNIDAVRNLHRDLSSLTAHMEQMLG